MSVEVAGSSPWLRVLPPVVATEVRRRRGEILARARGPLLDLDSPEGSGLLHGMAPVGSGGGETYATIISTCRLIEAPDLFASLSMLEASLAPDGELHLLEPVGSPGMVGLVMASLGACLPWSSGLHLSRDVPATVRATGLAVVDLERFVVATAVWPLRHFVQMRAIRLGPVRAGADDHPGRVR